MERARLNSGHDHAAVAPQRCVAPGGRRFCQRAALSSARGVRGYGAARVAECTVAVHATGGVEVGQASLRAVRELVPHRRRPRKVTDRRQLDPRLRLPGVDRCCRHSRLLWCSLLYAMTRGKRLGEPWEPLARCATYERDDCVMRSIQSTRMRCARVHPEPGRGRAWLDLQDDEKESLFCLQPCFAA